MLMAKKDEERQKNERRRCATMELMAKAHQPCAGGDWLRSVVSSAVAAATPPCLSPRGSSESAILIQGGAAAPAVPMMGACAPAPAAPSDGASNASAPHAASAGISPANKPPNKSYSSWLFSVTGGQAGSAAAGAPSALERQGSKALRQAAERNDPKLKLQKSVSDLQIAVQTAAMHSIERNRLTVSPTHHTGVSFEGEGSDPNGVDAAEAAALEAWEQAAAAEARIASGAAGEVEATRRQQAAQALLAALSTEADSRESSPRRNNNGLGSGLGGGGSNGGGGGGPFAGGGGGGALLSCILCCGIFEGEPSVPPCTTRLGCVWHLMRTTFILLNVIMVILGALLILISLLFLTMGEASLNILMILLGTLLLLYSLTGLSFARERKLGPKRSPGLALYSLLTLILIGVEVVHGLSSTSPGREAHSLVHSVRSGSPTSCERDSARSTRMATARRCVRRIRRRAQMLGVTVAEEGGTGVPEAAQARRATMVEEVVVAAEEAAASTCSGLRTLTRRRHHRRHRPHRRHLPHRHHHHHHARHHRRPRRRRHHCRHLALPFYHFRQ